jgi:hypothetical protein
MMTEAEIQALLPKRQKPALDVTFYRNLTNHWSMFGPTALVKKQGRGWIVDFCGHGHPTVYKTKREAMHWATKWVLETSSARLSRAV